MTDRPPKERSAYEAALVLLGSRGHSSEELRRKLSRKGFERSDVAVALERLTENGLVDDAKFAAEFARSRLTGQRPASVRRVRQELMRRGVDGGTASESLALLVVEEGIDEPTALEVAARKKLSTMVSLDVPVQRRRLFSYLARKGYEIGDINRLLARIFG
jgi:regulatory protein